MIKLFVIFNSNISNNIISHKININIVELDYKIKIY